MQSTNKSSYVVVYVSYNNAEFVFPCLARRPRAGYYYLEEIGNNRSLLESIFENCAVLTWSFPRIKLLSFPPGNDFREYLMFAA